MQVRPAALDLSERSCWLEVRVVGVGVGGGELLLVWSFPLWVLCVNMWVVDSPV